MESLYCGSNNGISKQQQHQISSPMLKREEDSQLLDEDIDDDNRDDRVDDKEEEAYVKAKQNGFVVDHSGGKEKNNKPFDYYLDSASRSSLENVDQENELDNVNNARNIPRRMSKINNNNNNNSNNNSITSGSYQRRQSKNFNYSPDTTDYDSESSMRFITSEYPTNIPKMIHTATNVSSASAAAAAAMVEMSGGPIVSSSSSSYAKYCTSMPVLEDGLSSGHASDNENNNPIPSSNDFYNNNKRNSSSIASSSTISTIQKQYQENLVQTHANNNIFYTNNNNTSSSNNNTSHGMVKSSSGNNNGVLLNNGGGDLEQPPSSKVRSAQSPLNYHPYYAMRYDTTPSTATSTVTAVSSSTIKEPSTSLRYDNNNGIGGANNNKELTTSRYENGKELLNAASHGGLLSNNKIFKNRDPELESLYTISKCDFFFFFLPYLHCSLLQSLIKYRAMAWAGEMMMMMMRGNGGWKIF